MMMRILSFVFALAVGGLVGCGKGSDPAGAVAVYTAPEKTVLARVGETEITVGDYRRRLVFETSVRRLTMMNAKNRPKDAEKRLAGFERARARSVLPQLVHVVLLNRYLDSACGGAAVGDADKIVAREVRRFGAKIGKKGASLAEIAGAIGVEPAYLEAQFLLPAREAKARMTFDPACTNVTEAEIDGGIARLDDYTKRAVATNRLTWAVCSNALARVKAGEGFAAVAASCGAADPKEATEWGWFSREDFDMMTKRCPAFKRWAFQAKVGDVGGPFDIDDGLSIVKVVGHQEGTAADSTVSKQAEEVQLVRINFAMVEEQPEPRTREHCREVLLLLKSQDADARLFTKLFNETKIVYPNGTKLNFTK